MCIKGFTAGELLAHPARLTTPLVRGRDGQLVAASWDAALDLVAERLLAHPRRARPGGAGRLRQRRADQREGVPAGQVRPGRAGHAAHRLQRPLLHGSAAARPEQGVRHRPRAAVPGGRHRAHEDVAAVGRELADTLPPIMQWLDEQQARGRLIVVDPRRTETARQADLHLQLTPGIDLALANGLLHLAIEERLIDAAYIAARTVGFEAVRRAVLEVHPAHVERLTGVPIDDQLRTVRRAGRRGEQHAAVGPRARAADQGRRHGPGVHEPDAGAGQGRQAGQRLRLPDRPGQRPGRPRARPEGRPAPRLPADRGRRRPRGVARVWGVDPAALPRKGKSAVELLDASGRRAASAALLVFGSNVAVASPDAAQHRAQARGAGPAGGVRRLRERDRRRRRTWSCRRCSGPRKRGR